MANKKPKGLGKGLEAIFLENTTNIDDRERQELKISEVEPNRAQARKEFDEEMLSELAESIAAHGVIQPILVRPMPNGTYQIVAGERRWRASRMAGKSTIPAVVRDMEDKECAEISLIENLQRENLNPVEEAKGYRSLMDEYEFTQDQVAKVVFKSRPYITNSLRLLNLPDKVLKMLNDSEITSGHARALLPLEDEQKIYEVAKNIKENKLSVRETENLVKKLLNGKKTKIVKNNSRSVFFDEVEIALRDTLGRKINVRNKNKKSGILEIEFYDEEDLKNIARYFNK